VNIFLAHKKGVDEIGVEKFRKAVIDNLASDGIAATVVTGMEDFTANIASDGSFDAWARGVVSRHDTFTGKRVYDAVFSVGYSLGKATAQIVGAALNDGIPVVVCDELECGTIEFRRGTQLVVEDADDYANGWWIDT
jgi:hypothetical protein